MPGLEICMSFKHFIFLSLVLAVTSEVFAGDASRIVKLSETPAAVQKTIHSQVGDGTLGEIDKALNGGETVYNVGLTAKDGNERDFTMDED